MDYSPPGSSVHGILQARVVEWIAMLFSITPSLCTIICYLLSIISLPLSHHPLAWAILITLDRRTPPNHGSWNDLSTKKHPSCHFLAYSPQGLSEIRPVSSPWPQGLTVAPGPCRMALCTGSHPPDSVSSLAGLLQLPLGGGCSSFAIAEASSWDTPRFPTCPT